MPLLAFLSGVMRSICDDHWRRRRGANRAPRRMLAFGLAAEDAAPDPERTLAAAQALVEVHRLFARDPCALKIISGLAEGLTASEICRHYGMSERDYDTARKRMRRALLRGGLTLEACR